MMNKVLKYSVLRYSPSVFSGESINLGILFAEDSAGFYSFRYTRNLSRIRSFDDELDRDVLLELLKGIKEEVELKSREDQFDLEHFIRFYINNFRFDKAQMIVYDDLNKTLEDLYNLYFRFDLPKNKRPSKKEDQKIISQIIASNGQKTYHNKKVTGIFKEDIVYDIVAGDYYIKIFDFDGKDLKRCINTAKTWAWNCNHEKEKKVYIIYRYSHSDIFHDAFNIIKQIFDEAECRFYSIEEGIEVLREMAG